MPRKQNTMLLTISLVLVFLLSTAVSSFACGGINIEWPYEPRYHGPAIIGHLTVLYDDSTGLATVIIEGSWKNEPVYIERELLDAGDIGIVCMQSYGPYDPECPEENAFLSANSKCLSNNGYFLVNTDYGDIAIVNARNVTVTGVVGGTGELHADVILMNIGSREVEVTP